MRESLQLIINFAEGIGVLLAFALIWRAFMYILRKVDTKVFKEEVKE